MGRWGTCHWFRVVASATDRPGLLRGPRRVRRAATRRRRDRVRRAQGARRWFSTSRAGIKLGYHTLLAVALVLAPVGMRADDWPAPHTRNVFSKDGSHFVRIIPGSNWGDVVGFQGADTGEYARGLFYALQPDRSYRLIADVALVNPVAPVDALVTNRGELVTLDNWHNFGFGAVLAVYDPAGARRRLLYARGALWRGAAVGCAAVGVVAVVAMPTDRVRRSGDRDSYLHSRVPGR